MAFWNTPGVEPLRKNRWTILFTHRDLVSYRYGLKKCDKPSYKTSDITHKYGNYNYYYPGRVEWNPINITFASVRDPGAESPEVAKGLDNALLYMLAGYGILAPTSHRYALTGIRKLTAVKEMADITIQQLAANYIAASPGAGFIESWKLINPFFTNVKFGDLSYDSEEIVDIECTIRFDSVEYTEIKEIEKDTDT